MSTIDKIANIHRLINEIEQEDSEVGIILLEGFNLSLRTLQAVAEKGERTNVDISDHLQLVCKVLGIDLKDMIEQVVKDMSTQNSGDMNENKAPDSDTLDFITSDLDDYEKFIAQNKAKEDLDFLSKQI